MGLKYFAGKGIGQIHLMVILVKPAKPAAMAEKEMGVALFHGKEIQVQIYRTYFTDVGISTDFKHKIQVRGPQA